MIHILQNIWFQMVAAPLILAFIAQILYLLGKRSRRISADDFAGLPYALGIASLAVNATFSIYNPNRVDASNGVYLLLFLVMLIIAMFQRLLPWSPRGINIINVILGLLILSGTFYVWR